MDHGARYTKAHLRGARPRVAEGCVLARARARRRAKARRRGVAGRWFRDGVGGAAGSSATRGCGPLRSAMGSAARRHGFRRSVGIRCTRPATAPSSTSYRAAAADGGSRARTWRTRTSRRHISGEAGTVDQSASAPASSCPASANEALTLQGPPGRPVHRPVVSYDRPVPTWPDVGDCFGSPDRQGLPAYGQAKIRRGTGKSSEGRQRSLGKGPDKGPAGARALRRQRPD